VDTVFGVSMAPSTVRMVLVEGENGEGATIDQDGFPFAAAAGTGNPADQVLAAILGTQQGAAESGYRLASTGVAWVDPAQASVLRDALAAHRVENIMLVSAFLAAAALAHAHGTTIGYTHTGLLFIEPDCATLAVVDSADGSVADVRRASLPDDDADAVAELTAMAADAGGLKPSPQGLFVVGSNGVDVGMIRAALDAATPLTLSAPTEPDSALARGAALASAHAPLFDWSTSALAYAQDPGTGAVDPVVALAADVAALDGPVDPVGSDTQQRAYSAAPDDASFYTAVGDADFFAEETEPGRRPFLVALGVMMVFVFGVAALTLSLALDIRPSVSNRPSLGRSVVVPAKPAPPPVQAPPVPAVAPAAPAAPAPAPAAPPPIPVPQLPAPQLPPLIRGPGPLAPRPPDLGPGPGIPHGPGPGLPGLPHGGGGIPHLPGLGGFHL
jgi:hypothetical protein